MLGKTKVFVENNYPLILNKSYLSPPFRALTIEEERNNVDIINASGAHFVFVALGCPKQKIYIPPKIKFCTRGHLMREKVTQI